MNGTRVDAVKLENIRPLSHVWSKLFAVVLISSILGYVCVLGMGRSFGNVLSYLWFSALTLGCMVGGIWLCFEKSPVSFVGTYLDRNVAGYILWVYPKTNEVGEAGIGWAILPLTEIGKASYGFALQLSGWPREMKTVSGHWGVKFYDGEGRGLFKTLQRTDLEVLPLWFEDVGCGKIITYAPFFFTHLAGRHASLQDFIDVLLREKKNMEAIIARLEDSERVLIKETRVLIAETAKYHSWLNHEHIDALYLKGAAQRAISSLKATKNEALSKVNADIRKDLEGSLVEWERRHTERNKESAKPQAPVLA